MTYLAVFKLGLSRSFKTGTETYCFVKSFAECSYYKFLNQSTRARTYNSTFVSCGDTTLSIWYRFGGDAGNKIADACVKMNHCGVMNPGWLNGGHPAVADGTVLRRVCFSTDQSCCQKSIYISVRNCGEFYVYNLTSLPTCNLRYCGEGIEPPTTLPPGRNTNRHLTGILNFVHYVYQSWNFSCKSEI